jgi:hypothetical protein
MNGWLNEEIGTGGYEVCLRCPSLAQKAKYARYESLLYITKITLFLLFSGLDIWLDTLMLEHL